MKKFRLKWKKAHTFQTETAVVVVDDCDAHFLRNEIYRVSKGQVVRAGKVATGTHGVTPLSHDIMGKAGDGFLWRHIDGDPMNCRRGNFLKVSVVDHLANMREMKRAA